MTKWQVTYTKDQIADFMNLPQFVKAKSQVIVIFILRALLSRNLESLILLDRHIFLEELAMEISKANDGTYLEFSTRNLFDTSLSPRSYVLCAIRKK